MLSLSLRGRALHPNTRIDVRLLGPCFKTGRLEPLRQRPWLNRRPRPRPPYDVEGYNAPRCHIPKTFLQRAKPTLARRSTRTPGRSRMIDERHGLMPNASLSTISRTVSLPFQDTCHLSITLLVYYRSLANI